ncbi:MAG: bifunctional ADP-dependent NAD(P)H-hydrate dehydratase/NAD(P)H-hydrate epimerase [Aeromicrobium sp.]|nr:MAG: bifunctional ADP-dependent NAD(P)H-hydrate dehydratase/NAD(P)H-hydrate epimerase [Aeromicrobium sp.]
MLRAHLVEDIRRAEDAAAERVGPDGLMQRAANALADYLEVVVPAEKPVIFLIGPGNNGGDGLFAAARLSRLGRTVRVSVLSAERVHADGFHEAQSAGVTMVDGPRDEKWLVDALFGIGASEGLSLKAAEWANWARTSGAHVIAVDTPSGVGVDEGTFPASAFSATETVSFGTHKVSGLVPPASLAAGRIELVDIGLAEFLGEAAVEVLEMSDGHRFATQLTPVATDHKYSRGVVGVLAGSGKYPGAAILCVAGALGGPTSMVRYLGEREIAMTVISEHPEVVAQAGQVQAFVVGSGGADEPGPVNQALASGVLVVVDATGLKHLPERFDVDALLTPHAGELATMLGVDRAAIESEPLRHARLAATRWDATVLLKGAHTLVVAPDGRVRVNHSGTPWLATAGAGDVLAGFAGSLMSAGLDAFDAGSVAALIHGVAAEEVNPGGPITASQVAGHLSGVLARFLTGEAA